MSLFVLLILLACVAACLALESFFSGSETAIISADTVSPPWVPRSTTSSPAPTPSMSVASTTIMFIMTRPQSLARCPRMRTWAVLERCRS